MIKIIIESAIASLSIMILFLLSILGFFFYVDVGDFFGKINLTCSSIEQYEIYGIWIFIIFSVFPISLIFISTWKFYLLHNEYLRFSKIFKNFGFLVFFLILVLNFVVVFAQAYWITGIQGIEVGDAHRDVIYFSVMTMTNSGYGEYYPCPQSRSFTIIQSVLGIFLLPLILTFILNARDKE